MTRRHESDFYPTPPPATRALMAAEPLSGPIWEPACGDGAISDVLMEAHPTISTDLYDRGHGESGVDFLATQHLLAPTIVTNPPFRHAQAFIQHAIDLGAKKHCWLLRLAFLEGKRRHDELFAHHRPARIFVFSRRLTLWRGDETPTGSGTTAYAWFVWDGDSTETKVSWL